MDLIQGSELNFFEELITAVSNKSNKKRGLLLAKRPKNVALLD